MGAHATGARPAARLSRCRQRRTDAARRDGGGVPGARGAELRLGELRRDHWTDRDEPPRDTLRGVRRLRCRRSAVHARRGRSARPGRRGTRSGGGRRGHHHDPRASRGAQPVARAGATARRGREADRAAGADDRAGAGARPVRRRGHRAHEGARVLPRAIRRRRGAAGARALRTSRASATSSRVVDGAQALGMLDFACAISAATSMRPASTSGSAAVTASGMLYVRREMLDRLWPVEPRGIDASPPVITPTQSDGHVGVPAALHKLGNIVPLRLARAARRRSGAGIPAADRPQHASKRAFASWRSMRACGCSSCRASKC